MQHCTKEHERWYQAVITSAEYEHMLEIAKKAKENGFDYTVFNKENELVAVFKYYKDFLVFDTYTEEPDFWFYNMKGRE